MKLTINYQKLIGDTYTPVELYLKLRDKYPHSFLLESSDYSSNENSFSYIGLAPIASYIADEDKTSITYIDGSTRSFNTRESEVTTELNHFRQSIEITNKAKVEFLNTGLFGYTSYDSIPLFESISFKPTVKNTPLIQYHFFKYVLVFNHYNTELYLVEHLSEGESSQLSNLFELINGQKPTSFPFSATQTESTTNTEEEFLELIEKGKQHCFRGDVFQLVLSRQFKQKFSGDEFNVYRALRSINPSPYLFYFDYGNFKIFGSSPEAQLVIRNNKAYIHPIAGTFKRTGDLAKDQELAKALSLDPKENAEHIMLVDLARNDLSKHSQKVNIEKLKHVEYYSHVIHLVSKVSGELQSDFNPIEIFKDTFPAGTLSGAPKYKAMELIDQYENTNRGLYGGAVGVIKLNGEMNQAIYIRSILSQDNELQFQAGCGIVTKSNTQSELEEINNKLRAIRTAIIKAQEL
ncbi:MULTISPECIES: anthranilate synthase component I family protein [Myroides]|uniref:Anthranilate synthase component 1 n=1 Tax=Myroides albus TaxID=2562892 RepID=A0A6I3LER9_9FLAO|nr:MULTISPECIES: chorismate-binding protein [Myroides]MTG96703.1 anthranilate synthase component I family protein [Myroides albus]MVX34715.1 anthranilate synthase component I family protein [Myroides sp. LoEW2-1]UVD80885.1 chorismate-binding protein [Myroides albus]